MIIIDCAAPTTQSGILPVKEQAMKFFEETFTTTSEGKAQDKVISYCAKIFNNKYTLLKNVSLEGLEASIPLILIGPPGIFVLIVSGIKGVYRAKEELWLEMKGTTRQYHPVRPNLVQRTLEVKGAVGELLKVNGFEQSEPNGLLVFTNPGVHIDTVRPAVRILLTDGFERLMNGLLQKPPVYLTDELKKLVNLFHQTLEKKEEPIKRDQFDLMEDEKSKPSRRTNALRTDPLPDEVLTKKMITFSKRVNLTTGQWVFIGVMLVAQIGLLMAIILIIIMTS